MTFPVTRSRPACQDNTTRPCLPLRALSICLRGAGQVMFQNNSWTGLFFLAGIFWGAWTANMPAVATGSVLGLVCATLTAVLLHAPKEDIRQGLHGYNGMLVGCALPGFCDPTPLLWGYTALGAVFSTVIMLGLSRLLRTWKVSAMTAPFVFTTWLLLLATYSFGHLHVTSLPQPSLITYPASFTLPVWPSAHDFGVMVLHGISQVFLINNSITGLLFLLGLACASLWAACFALVASALAAASALLLGADSAAVTNGLFQFSAVLTAIGLGTTFYQPHWRPLCFAVVGVLFTVIVQGALDAFLRPFGIPTLTFPFVLAAWLFLLPNLSFLPATHRS